MSNIEIILTVWCICVGASDMYARRIPNILTLGASIIAALWLITTGHALLGANWQSVALGIVIGLTLTFPAYVSEMLGAGDVKLLLAIALIGGWYLTLLTYVVASAFALIFCLFRVFASKLSKLQNNSRRWIPFGSALSAGLLFSLMVAK